MKIPYEAIREASMAIDDEAYKLIGWEGVGRILEAAATNMHAQAMREAVDAFPLETIVAPDNAVVWMMRRADELSKQ